MFSIGNDAVAQTVNIFADRVPAEILAEETRLRQ